MKTITLSEYNFSESLCIKKRQKGVSVGRSLYLSVRADNNSVWLLYSIAMKKEKGKPSKL
jgi:hypothetical protein